jgi:hypothetical protein
VRKSRSQQVTIELMGGLGNQLFALTAGLHAAHKLQVTLRPYLRKPGPSETTHTSSVHSLLAGLPVVNSLPGLEGVLLKIRLGIRNIAVNIGVPALWINRATKIVVSPVVGYSKSLDTAKRGDYIVGYFLTHRYLDELRHENRMPKLALSKESEWFRDQLQKLEATNPIVIHVRRGDYLQSENDYIGALSLNYYLKALRLITRENESSIRGRPIWVFSDQPSLVREEFRGVKEFERAEFIEAPDASDPAESLILMSSASSIVISNSTFSWWSAALSQDAEIVAPNKWFKKSDDPDSLIPSSWLRAESSWLEKLHSES